MGLLLLSGYYWHILRWLVLLLFTVFAGYALYLALKGAASCGCFGPLRVNPWWTFVLDSFVVLSIFASDLLNRRATKNAYLSPTAQQWPECRHALAAVIGIIALCAVLLSRYIGQQMAFAGNLTTSVGRLVILEPEKWVGRQDTDATTAA